MTNHPRPATLEYLLVCANNDNGEMNCFNGICSRQRCLMETTTGGWTNCPPESSLETEPSCAAKESCNSLQPPLPPPLCSALKFKTAAASLLRPYRHQPNKNKATKKTTFTTMTIYYHQTIAGDHPCVQRGLPIALGWKCVDQVTRPVMDDESLSSSLSSSSSSWRLSNRNDCRLSPSQRHLRLRSAGVGLADIMRQTAEMQNIRRRKQRQ